jgi:hypothetical protein
VTSVTSEFSGCVLYNEIRKKVDNPDIKQLMTYLHARRVPSRELHQHEPDATSAWAWTCRP